MRRDFIINKQMLWKEFQDKMLESFGRNFLYVDDLHFNVKKEIRIGERVEFDDYQILKYLTSLHIMEGDLCIITDWCYKEKEGPFIVNANELEQFVNTYKMVYGEAFYSTDIVIINFKKKLLWVFFHEGICWLSEG